MFSLLLKKALPFALTFVAGAALTGLAGLVGLTGGGKKSERALVTRTYDLGGRCRTRSRRLVAETKPLTILFKPDARWPRVYGGENSARVQVTFGADGRVQNVEPSAGRGACRGTVPQKWEAVERAARGIQFAPEVVNSVPVSVTKEVEIHFMGDLSGAD